MNYDNESYHGCGQKLCVSHGRLEIHRTKDGDKHFAHCNKTANPLCDEKSEKAIKEQEGSASLCFWIIGVFVIMTVIVVLMLVIQKGDDDIHI